MAKYYTLVTDIGRAKMANAQVMGEKVSFSKIALGSSETKPRENQTALGKEEWRGPISNVSLDKNNPNWIVVEAVVPSNVGGFEIAEVGVYDEEGHLIVVGNHPKTYKPKMDEGTTKDVAIRIIIEVSNSEIVELKVDPSVVIATRSYVESAIELAMASIDFSVVEKQINQHVSDADTHVTAQDKKNWNAKETPSAAQAKAAKALKDAKAYTDQQIGEMPEVDISHLETKEEANKKLEKAKSYTDLHSERTDNPHKVTKSQVGLSNVDNVKQASKVDLDSHINDEVKHVTASDRTSWNAKETPPGAQAKAAKALEDAKVYTDTHEKRTDNPHKVTKSQIGLSNVQNYPVASVEEAELGVSHNRYMTPSLTAAHLLANGVKSVAGISSDSTGDVPLTIGDLTTDGYLPPTAPPRDYPLGVTTFRGNLAQTNEWKKLVNDGTDYTRVLVLTHKASNVWQATQTIYLIDGYSNTGNTIQHHAMYVRSAMASTISEGNQWSEPVKVLDGHDLSDSTTSDSSDTVATSKAVKTVNDNIYYHENAVATSTTKGHVKLSDSVTSASGVFGDVAATPSAVKKSYDKAVEAKERANEAFQLGDKVKKDLVASLSSSGLPVDNEDSFEDIVSKINNNNLKDIKIAEVEMIGNQNEVKGLGFKPDFLLPVRVSNPLYSYTVALKGEEYHGEILARTSGSVRGVTFHSDGFKVNGSHHFSDNKFLAIGGIDVEQYRENRK